MSESHRVWITGIGLVTPFGFGIETSWNGLKTGQRALTAAALTDGSNDKADASWRVSSAIGTHFQSEAKPDWLFHLANAAVDEALRDARFSDLVIDRERIGCVFGTSKGDVRFFADWMQAQHEKTCVPEIPWIHSWPNGVAVRLANLFDWRGPLLAPVTACATGLSSIVRGVDLIRDGSCDVVIAGSGDASLTPAMLSSFRRLGVLARSDDDPGTSVRPFDRHRSGFLIGEGAAVFVLESETSARSRDRMGYAEWLSGGCLADAAGLTQLSSEPASLVRLIEDTLRRGQLDHKELDYISLHGTATRMNDDLEARAVINVFGNKSQNARLCGSSLKGAIGHLLGAAGSVEFAAMLLAMRDQFVPATVNLTEPEYDFDFVPQLGRPHEIQSALKLSLGFGGHLVAGLVRKIP